MSYKELLESAKSGNRPDYDILCGSLADDIYRVAYLTLMNKPDAEAAVKTAFSDGYGSIARINDLPHLKAWILRELTKNIVAKLKEYKARGEAVTPDGEIPSAVTSLSDIDRLIYSIFSLFNYSVREISIITSLTEENITKKLKNSNDRISNDIIIVKAFISSCNAPDDLKPTEEKKSPKLMKFIPTGGEYSEEEDETADTEPEETAEEENAAEEAPVFAPEEKITAVPEEKEEPKAALNAETFIDIIAAEKIKGSEFLALIGNTRISNSAYHEIEQNPELTRPRLIELLENSPLTEADYAKMLTAIKQRREKLNSAEKQEKQQASLYDEMGLFNGHRERPRRKKLEEKKKSDLALALEKDKDIGKNTDNAADTSQNEVITGGTLTFSPVEAEYSVKTLRKSEEKNKEADKKEEEKPAEKEQPREKTPVISDDTPKKTADTPVKPQAVIPPEMPFPVSEKKPAPAKPSKPEAAEEPEEDSIGFKIEAPLEAISGRAEDANDDMSFTTDINLDEAKGAYIAEDIDDLEEFDEDELDNHTFTDGIDPFSQIGKGEAAAKPMVKEPVLTKAPEKTEVKEEPDEEEKQPPKKNRMSEDFREKYKGNDYFIDDDEYYDGVNRGKLIFCAVCAVLLIGVSFLIRYLATGSLMPTDSPAENPSEITVSLPDEITSNEDIYAVMSAASSRAPMFKEGYYRGDNTPYTESLCTTPFEIGDTMLIPEEKSIKAVVLDKTAPKIKGSILINENKTYKGFLADETNIYLVYEDEELYIEIYGSDLTLTDTYSQSGRLIGINADNDRLIAITALNAEQKETPSETDLPTYTIKGEKKALSYSEIEVPEKISYSGFTVSGVISGGEATVSAVMGGYDSFVRFNKNGYELLVADCNKTYVRSYSLIGTRANLDKETVYNGEAFSAQSLNGNVLTGYDPYKNCVTMNRVTDNSNEVMIMAENSVPKGIAYNGDKTYLITESDGKTKLYGYKGMEEITDMTSGLIYTEKLRACGELLAGMKAEADSDGNRTGLRLSLYSCSEGLKEEASAVIGVDPKTDGKYVSYLSGDGEANPLNIAVTPDGSRLAVSTVYFDGISEIERILIYENINGSLTELGNIMLFDINSDYRALSFRDDTLFIITEEKIITVDASNCSPTGYYTGEEEAEEAETSDEEEQSGEDSENESDEDEVTIE